VAAERKHVNVKTSKFLPLVFGIGLLICVPYVESQLLTGTPVESSSTPKQREQKRPEATPAAESTLSPSGAESPAISPTSKRVRKKTAPEVSPTPTPTPVATPAPRKFRLRFPRLFKPKRSPSP